MLVALLLPGATACSDDAPTGTATVEMVKGQRFDPTPLTVTAGTTVTFVNESAEAHTVTAYEDGIPADAKYFSRGGFLTEVEARENLAGAIVGQEDTFEVTFGVAGTYEYFCIPHESQGMKARIVVEE